MAKKTKAKKAGIDNAGVPVGLAGAHADAPSVALAKPRATPPPLGVGEERRLPRSFFAIAAERLAPRLIGHRLVRVLEDGARLSGVIVETEAYLGPPDRACHTFGGRRTPRNEQMYGPPGTAYVYFTYGMHFCMNVVCGEDREGVAVLIRALDPVEGQERMRQHRGGKGGWKDTDLCSGPAKLCQALAIDRTWNGADLVEGAAFFIEAGTPAASASLHRTTRIGIDGRGDWTHKPLRWYLKSSPHVSVLDRSGAKRRAAKSSAGAAKKAAAMVRRQAATPKGR